MSKIKKNNASGYMHGHVYECRWCASKVTRILHLCTRWM